MIKTAAAYQEYLKTDHWKNLRQKVLTRDGHKCVRCPSKTFLQAHHKFYRAFWTDSVPEDLITLCRPCHKKEHGLVTKPEPVIRPVIIFQFMHEVDLARGRKLISREEFKKWRKHFRNDGWVKPKKKKKHHTKKFKTPKPIPILYYQPHKPKWVNRGTSSN